MNCFSCSKNIKKEIKCDKCDNKLCSDSCLAFHYIFYHQEEKNQNSDNNINNGITDINNNNENSPYITKGYFLKEIKYESIYNIKNFQHHLVNGKPKLLGFGSFGKVFLEINKINKKLYAIKHIEKSRIKKVLKTLDHIYSEIEIQSKIRHPNIVKVLYANENDKYFDIVLEYAKNGNLFYYIQNNRHLSEAKSFKIFIQIVNAIYFLHKNNFIHRDIKPENILLFENCVAKLCDFGWCVEFKDELRNTYCGTTEYMAPEMFDEKKYGKEIDIWSLGILLYEMLHGHSPFKPDKPAFNDNDVINNIKNQKNIKYSNKISNECIDLIKHLIDKNIKKRYSLDDILNSHFVKNFERQQYCLSTNNIAIFQRNESNEKFNSINTSRIHNSIDNYHQKNNIIDNKLTYVNRRNTSRKNINNILNSFFSMENENSNNNIINNENNNNKFTSISQYKRKKSETISQNKCYHRSVSLPKPSPMNQKFSSTKIEKINKNILHKEEDLENINLSNIFNDDSIFNNNSKTIESNHNNYPTPPTININILLNEINFTNEKKDNYESKILKKFFDIDKNNNLSLKTNINNKNLRDSPLSSDRNSYKFKSIKNDFIKKRINIFTNKKNDINKLNDINRNNTSKNLPISIKTNNNNISKHISINYLKINQLVNYFDLDKNQNKINEKDKTSSFSVSKNININNKKENNNSNKNPNIDKKENESIHEINSKSELNKEKSNIDKKVKNDILMIEAKNYMIKDFESSNNLSLISNNKKNGEIIKTPKKSEDKFQIPIKVIFSNLSQEINSINKKEKS